MKNTIIKTPSVSRLIAASSIGTILEWYDFSLFAYLTPILAKLFFPEQNSLTALMSTYAIFAVGFFVRPLGAIFFGHYGDRLGRQKILLWSILLMSISTFLIGLLPTHQTIGFAAAWLLMVLRLLQGFSASGESTGALLFVLETTAFKKRGFIGGMLWAMVGIGMLMGSFAATIVSHHEEYSWAWRVPFLLGLVTGIVGYFLRKNTSESLMFLEARNEGLLKTFPLRSGFMQHKKEMLIIISFYILSAMISYLIFVFMPTYAAKIVGFPLQQTTLITTLAFLCVTLLVPVGGYLSDRVGRKKCLAWSSFGFVILSYPLFWYMNHTEFSHFVFTQIIFVILASVFQGTLTATVFEMLSTSVRFSVMAVCYNVSYSLFGGTAPFVATYIVHITGNKSAPGWYLVVGAMVAFIAVLQLKNRKDLPPGATNNLIGA